MLKLVRLLFYLVIGFSFFFYLFFAQYERMPTLSNELNLFVFTLIASVSSGVIITLINTRLNQRLPWRKNVFNRFLAGLLIDFIALGSFLVLIGFLANLTSLTSYALFPEDMMERQLELKLTILSFLTLFLVTLVEFNGYSYNEYSVGQIRKLRAERKQLELQFEALKSQLSPHYLFNSMNTISSLVYRDPHVAETFIRNLADTFNYVLNTRDVKLVTLAEELDALKDYRYLLKIRYSAAVDLKLEIEEEFLNVPIPPLTLQLLVENAVKHNVISTNQPLVISVSVINNELRVLNNKTESPSNTASHRVGLDNIRKRYAHFTKSEIQVTEDDHFEVKLPMLAL